MKSAGKAGIVCCSDGLDASRKSQIDKLTLLLQSRGITPVFSDYIFTPEDATDGSSAGTPRERAEALMRLYENPDIRHIFEISGGDLANTILPFLDFDRIAASDKTFWGYSDLSVILNAIYARTGKSSVLYQLRHMIGSYAITQQKDFFAFTIDGRNDLFSFPFRFYRGSSMEGVVIGGNIRCFLKLAGTPYLPDFSRKILFLEAMSGNAARIESHYAQLQQMGAFDRVAGILLGTFTEMQRTYPDPEEPPFPGWIPKSVELLLPFLPDHLPIAKTVWIGHGEDAKALKIGEYYKLCRTTRESPSGKQR